MIRSAGRFFYEGPAHFYFMRKTIIFINGWAVPQLIGQSAWVWDREFWSDYKCVWLSSKTPMSDRMVTQELDRLERLLISYPGAVVAGHSLGGWWAANLALRPGVRIGKLVLWTPLGNANYYPIFNVTPRYHPSNQLTTTNYGPHRVLVYSAKNDLIVPPGAHANLLTRHFGAMDYQLEGDHFFQRNHKEALYYMKDWIEIK